MANLVVGQSGGPTAVINASLVGVVREARRHRGIKGILGMRFGIEGFLEEDLMDLDSLGPETLDSLVHTPGAALGSCRLRLLDEHLPRVLDVLKRHDIRYFLYIGGDDSQSTVRRVHDYCTAQGFEVAAVGIPKTVDNDLSGTDHTPGYGSAARFVALSAMQGGILAQDMRRVDPVLVFQAVGRDAGWLAAAAALARREEDDPPHLIYVPERPLTRERLLSDAEVCFARLGYVSIVVGEGIVWSDGQAVSGTSLSDRFGNLEFGSTAGVSAASVVKSLVCQHLGVRGEFQVVESLQMCAADRVSEVDRAEAIMVGEEAVRFAVSERSGVMVALVREPGPAYRCHCVPVPLGEVGKRRLPDAFIAKDGNFVTRAFLDYCGPLVGDLPRYARLKTVSVWARDKEA